MTDDRIVCAGCRNLDGDGRCGRVRALVAAGLAAGSQYHPVADLPRRCGQFAAAAKRKRDAA